MFGLWRGKVFLGDQDWGNVQHKYRPSVFEEAETLWEGAECCEISRKQKEISEVDEKRSESLMTVFIPTGRPRAKQTSALPTSRRRIRSIVRHWPP